MQTVDDKKITHWLRHDNVDAWARWANTPNGKSYLSKDPAKWAKLIWQSKAWRCLREWSLMGQEETLSFDERAPEMLLSILLGEERRNAKKESKTPEHVWSLFKKVVEVSIEKGWRPSFYIPYYDTPFSPINEAHPTNVERVLLTHFFIVANYEPFNPNSSSKYLSCGSSPNHAIKFSRISRSPPRSNTSFL
jgi:hypothetical protein